VLALDFFQNWKKIISSRVEVALHFKKMLEIVPLYYATEGSPIEAQKKPRRAPIRSSCIFKPALTDARRL
jgi:hypothetical protein